MNKYCKPVSRLLSAAILIGVAGAWNPAHATMNIVGNRYDNNRTAANLTETALSPTTVSASSFGKIGAYAVDGAIFAQPLYVAGVTVAGATAPSNVLYVATMNDVVYAFDADNPGTTLWKHDFRATGITPGTPFDTVTASSGMGVIGTPVIDAVNNKMYLVAVTMENGAYVQRLHVLDIRSGVDLGAVVITATAKGMTFDPKQHSQRPGLALAGGQVWLSFGSTIPGDWTPWHGWVITYDATTLAQTGAFVTTTVGNGGGIWQSGGAPAVDAAGNVYFLTGNIFSGSYDGINNFNESLLKFNYNGGLKLVDWFTPSMWPTLEAYDLDLTCNGPMLVPGTDLVAFGGKIGLTTVLHTGNLGHLTPNDSQVAQFIQTGPVPNYAYNDGDRIIGLAYWQRGANNSLMYAWPGLASLTSYTLNGTTFTQTQQNNLNLFGEPSAALSISANGTTVGSGILWVARNQGGGRAIGQAAVLEAYNADNIGQLLWSSTMNLARDDVGSTGRFVIPVVNNGKVYMATSSGSVVVYGLNAPNTTGSGSGATPAADWNFDAVSGTSVTDNSGSNQTLTLGQGITSVAGLSGNALHFSGLYGAGGVGTGGAYGNGPILNTAGSFSVSAWVNFDAIPSCGPMQTFVSQDGNTASGFYLQMLPGCGTTATSFRFALPAGDGDTFPTTVAMSGVAPVAGTWYHVVGIKNTTTNQMQIYVNGVLQGQVAAPTSWSAGGKFVLGRGKASGGERDALTGVLDGVEVFNAALTQPDVASLYAKSGAVGPLTAPLSVSLTAPAPGATAAVGSPLTLTASVTDANVGATISSVSFYDGSTLLGTVTAAPYSFVWTGPGIGAHTLTAVVKDSLNQSSTSSAVTVTVTGAPLTVNLTSPSSGSSVTVGTPVTLTATATDPNSGATISNVSFYDGSTVLASLTAAPYSFTWSNPAPGAHSITAKVTDSLNLSGTSATATLTVTTTPLTVALTGPATGSSVAAGSAIALGATVSDSNAGATLTSVSFYDGATLLGTASAAPFSFNWASPGVGSHSLTAVATDSYGVTGTSTATSVTVTSSPLAVTLGGPVSGSSVPSGSVIALSATATDPNTGGTVKSVRFLDGTTVLATVTAAPFSYNWTGAAVGSHTLTATATDNYGATGTSSASTVNVSAPVLPAATGSWSFNTAAGTSAPDDSGKGHPLTLGNGVTVSTVGLTGSALHFNGLYGNPPGTGGADAAGPVLTTSGSFSVSAWVKFDAIPSCGPMQTVASQEGNMASGFYLQMLPGCGTANNVFWFSMPAGDGDTFPTIRAAGTVVPVAGTWYHLVGIKNTATNQLQLYVNGTLQGTATAPASWNAAGKFVLGRGKASGGERDSTTGTIDSVYVYNSALTAAQVSALYASK